MGWALAGSAFLGALVGLAIYFGGNADYRAQAGWGGFVYWVLLSGVLGVGTGLAGATGGAVAVAIRDRDLRRSSSARIRIGTLGATIGAALPWIALAVAVGSGWWPLPLGIATLVALVTAALARIMLIRAERGVDGDRLEIGRR